MRKQLTADNKLSKVGVGSGVHEAVSDVRDAVRPPRKSATDFISLIVAAAAGGAVLWRSFRADAGTPEAAEQEARKDMEHVHRLKEGRAEKQKDRKRSDSSAGAKPDDKKRTDPGLHSSTKPEGDQCTTMVSAPGALVKELWCRFQTAECMTRAHALAFIGVLSLGPVLLFALAALGFVIHDASQVERFVHDLIARFLPGRQASQAANNLIAQTHILESARTLMRGKWWAVSIGVVSITWAAIGLFAGAADAMNAAWAVKETRSFIKLRLVCLGVFLGAGVLFLLSLVPSALPALVRHVQLPIVGALPKGWWLDVVSWLLAIVINGAMFTVIFRFLPNAKVPWKSAFFGGAVAGLLWELFKQAFAFYVSHFGNFDKLYGTLGGAVLLVTWILYSCVVLLACAIICKMHSEHVYEGGVVGSSPS